MKTLYLKLIVVLLSIVLFSNCENSEEVTPNNNNSDNTSGNTGDYNPESYKLENVALSTEEQELYDLIMEYRAENSLPSIPVSRSLTYVAQVHCWDVETNSPDEGSCNLHSWSSAGSWSACCYTSDHSQASCMWDKPKEMTSYPSNGYEISYWSSGSASAQGALNGWKSSSGHNAVIINEGTWKNNDWKAIGIGIYDGYAMVWFGTATDPADPL